jgi:hypothetical protein
MAQSTFAYRRAEICSAAVIRWTPGRRWNQPRNGNSVCVRELFAENDGYNDLRNRSGDS